MEKRKAAEMKLEQFVKELMKLKKKVDLGNVNVVSDQYRTDGEPLRRDTLRIVLFRDLTEKVFKIPSARNILKSVKINKKIVILPWALGHYHYHRR